MLKVGIVGWRGMVGSVLLDRMRAEEDFKFITPTFFSTSDAGGVAPLESRTALQDAFDLQVLAEHDVLVSCQGSDYTREVYAPLRNGGWSGYWIDAASLLRMDSSACLILDPVNRSVIDKALNTGVRTFVGPNCTTSLMLMACSGLFREGLVEWMNSMTYQAASGAGAKNMIELIRQMGGIGALAESSPHTTAIELERQVLKLQNSSERAYPTKEFGYPLAGSLIPWIDSEPSPGTSKEEWKIGVETNKILSLDPVIPVDGLCVRVGVLRCHSQALLIKLKQSVEPSELEQILSSGNDWVDVVPNNLADSKSRLTPAAVSGALRVPIGRVRRAAYGSEYITAFTVGDQLLWGAAEPLRRMVRILAS